MNIKLLFFLLALSVAISVILFFGLVSEMQSHRSTILENLEWSKSITGDYSSLLESHKKEIAQLMDERDALRSQISALNGGDGVILYDGTTAEVAAPIVFTEYDTGATYSVRVAKDDYAHFMSALSLMYEAGKKDVE